jgi:hypothetical protein
MTPVHIVGAGQGTIKPGETLADHGITIIQNKPTVVDGIIDSFFTEMDAKMDAAVARMKMKKPSKHPTTIHEAEILMETWEEHHPGKEMPRKVAQRCMDLMEPRREVVIQTPMGFVRMTPEKAKADARHNALASNQRFLAAMEAHKRASAAIKGAVK